MRSIIILTVLSIPATTIAADTEPPPSKGGKPLTVSTPDVKALDDEPLPFGALLRLGHLRAWHGIEGGLLASPDGKRLVAGFADHSVRVWEAETGKLVRAFKPFSARIQHLALSPDGKTIAAATGHSIQLLDMDAKTDTPRTLQGHQGDVMSVAFSSDSSLLVSAAYDHKIKTWHTSIGRQFKEITGGMNDHFTSVTFTKNFDAVIACTNDGRIQMWDARNGQAIRDFRGANGATVLHALPDGKTLAAISANSGLHFWNLETGKQTKQLKEYAGYGAFSPDGDRVVVAPISFPTDAPIRVYDLKLQREAFTLPGHRGGTYLFAFSPDGRTLSTYGNDHTLRRWSMLTWKELSQLGGHQNRVTGVVFTNDGKQLISCCQDGSVRFWDPITGKERRRLATKDEHFNSLALSPDGKTLALGSGPLASRWRWDFASEKNFSHLRFWNLEDNKERDCFYLPSEMASELQFTPDGGEVLVTNFQHVRFHDAKTGRERRPIPDATHGLNAAIVSPDGKRVVTSTNEPALRQVGKIAYWTADKGKEEFSRSFMFGSFSSLAYSPDGKWLAVAGGGHRNERALTLWESPSDKIVRQFDTQRQDIYKIACSPDGRLLAAADPEGISVFEMATGQPRWRFMGGHIEKINALAFSPDSRKLASAGDDTLIYLWDLTGNPGRMKLDTRDLDAAWAILADQDGQKAGRTIMKLAAAPNDVVPYLQQRLGTLSDDDRKRIVRLVDDLDSNNFKVRDRATKELENLGEAAVSALTPALQSKSEEVRTKAEQILKKIGPGEDPVTHASARRAVRAIEALEHAGTPEAIALLKEIQKGAKSRLQHEEAEKALKRLEKR